MRISVVIPSYNRRDWLMACLDSVAAQRRAPDEVIVVDDGSTDGTPEAVRARTDVTLIEQANAGPGAARNRGAAEATGDYLAFLDSDDLWFPWSLEVMAGLIETHGNPALLFARFQDFTTAQPEGITETAPQGLAFPDYLASADHGFFAGAGMMVIARSAFAAAGGFSEARMNSEDHDLALRLGTAPGFVQVQEPVIVAHRMHDSNEMGDAALNLAGLERLVTTEQTGGYPGGTPRAAARQSLILRHVRPAVVAGAKTGAFGKVARLYRQTFLWNLRAGRGAFLAGAPALAVAALLRRGRA